MNKLFAILCWCALVVSAAVPTPLRTDYFTQGCGGDGQGNYYQPVVADDGTVAVIAPKPGEKYIPTTPQRAGYLVSANDLSVTQLFAPGYGLVVFPGVASFFFYRAACSIVADVGRENFWDVSFDVAGTDLVSPRIHYYSASLGESFQDVGIDYTSDLILRLLPTSDGSVAFLHAVDGSDAPLVATGLYSLNQEKITLKKSISLPYDLGFAPAFTADGTAIFYIGLDEEFNTENAMLALYRYDLESDTAVMLEDIGLRNSLKVYDAKYNKGLPMVAANADGTVVAYRWANGTTSKEGGVLLRMAVKNTVTGDYEFGFASRLSGTDQTLLVDETEGKGTNILDCQDPAVSADGRYIAFTARATNASVGAAIRQAWRYDRQEQRLECLSDGLSGDCHATALSPNGRHVAFVATDSATALPQVFRVDCGPAITLSERQMVMHPKETVELGLEVVATDMATVTIAGDFPGTLMTSEGDEMLAGTPYPANTLPWSLFAGTDDRCGNLTITVTEGENTVSAELSIIVSNFTNLTSDVLPRSALYSYSYSDIHFTSNGSEAILLTDAPLVPQDSDRIPVQDVYRLDVATGMLKLLTGESTFSTNVYSPQISGDGNVVYWVSQAGELWTDGGVRLTTGVSQLAPAVSHDGMVMVIRKGNALWRSTDSGESWTQVRVEDVPETAVYNTPMLSYDGGVLVFTVREAGKLELYVLDGAGDFRRLASEISALEGLTQDGKRVLVRQTDGTFAWISIGNAKATAIAALSANAREVSLAGNGRYVAYTAPSSADATQTAIWLCDLGKGVTTEVTEGANGSASAPMLSAGGRLLLFASDATNLIDGLADTNEENDLFLYMNPDWKNALPGAPIYTAHNLQEDPPQPLLFRLGLQDNDNDALVPVLTTPATLGTAHLVPPCEGQLDYLLSYLPPKDFCGTDSVQIRAWDGTGWGALQDLKLFVQNVNDPPVWDEDVPVSLELQAGGALQVTFHATDVDEENPTPDVLEYALSGEVPSWAIIDTAAGALTLRPGFSDDGEYTLTVQVTDGTAVIDHQLSIKVVPLGEYEVPLALLRKNGEDLPADVDSESALGQWLTAFAGCWVSFDDSWQALSLPGDADIAELCAVLGCEQIWLYSTGVYIAVSDGLLPAGTGFWAKVDWPDDANEVSLFLTPTLQRTCELPRFCGPLVDEEFPAGLHGVEDGAWVDCPGWQLGRGYFRY